LGVLLAKIGLVDAEGVGPEDALNVCMPEPLQGGKQAGGDAHLLAAAEGFLHGLRIAPYVGEGFILESGFQGYGFQPAAKMAGAAAWLEDEEPDIVGRLERLV